MAARVRRRHSVLPGRDTRHGDEPEDDGTSALSERHARGGLVPLASPRDCLVPAPVGPRQGHGHGRRDDGPDRDRRLPVLSLLRTVSRAALRDGDSLGPAAAASHHSAGGARASRGRRCRGPRDRRCPRGAAPALRAIPVGDAPPSVSDDRPRGFEPGLRNGSLLGCHRHGRIPRLSSGRKPGGLVLLRSVATPFPRALRFGRVRSQGEKARGPISRDRRGPVRPWRDIGDVGCELADVSPAVANLAGLPLPAGLAPTQRHPRARTGAASRPRLGVFRERGRRLPRARPARTMAPLVDFRACRPGSSVASRGLSAERIHAPLLAGSHRAVGNVTSVADSDAWLHPLRRARERLAPARPRIREPTVSAARFDGGRLRPGRLVRYRNARAIAVGGPRAYLQISCVSSLMSPMPPNAASTCRAS